MNDIDRLLGNFDERFRELFTEAKQLEISKAHTDIEIGRCILVIAARDFEPLSEPNRSLMHQLRLRL